LIFSQEVDSEAKYSEILIPLEKMKQMIVVAKNPGENTI
jgi:hypothetical protein